MSSRVRGSTPSARRLSRSLCHSRSWGFADSHAVTELIINPGEGSGVVKWVRACTPRMYKTCPAEGLVRIHLDLSLTPELKRLQHGVSRYTRANYISRTCTPIITVVAVRSPLVVLRKYFK